MQSSVCYILLVHSKNESLGQGKMLGRNRTEIAKNNCGMKNAKIAARFGEEEMWKKWVSDMRIETTGELLCRLQH